jgi:hypothetical protein
MGRFSNIPPNVSDAGADEEDQGQDRMAPARLGPGAEAGAEPLKRPQVVCQAEAFRLVIDS